ncbi:MAG: hypothetical protein LUI08_02945 [Prevotella sp.]|nr:hypothetical protein [Prevotella sp.]
MKKLLFLLCLLSASLTSTYADNELSFSDATGLSGWGVDDQATDSQTQTMTFTGAWANWGWSLNNADYSGYDGYSAVTVTFTTNITTGYVYVGAAYGDETSDSGAAYINKTEADETEYTVTYTFDETKYSSMSNIYLSVCDLEFGSDGLPHKTGQVWDDSSNSMVDGEVVNATITIKSATLISKDIQPIVNINNEAYIQTYWPKQQNWNESNSSESGDDGQESGEGVQEGEDQEGEDQQGGDQQGGQQGGETQTTNSDTITPTTGEYEIPGATLTYYGENNGLGWGYYSSGNLDISAYKGIEVKYSVSGYTGDAPTITLEMGSKTGEAEEHEINGVSGNDGTISFTFSDDSSFDPANVVKIVIKATSACTVNVDYIKLVTTTIETSSSSFITTTTTGEGDDAKTSYYVNLNVTKTGGYWGTVTTDTPTNDGDPITSATITYKAANNLAGFEYASNDATATHLDLTSYTPENGTAEDKVTFTDMEVRYTISSTAARSDDNRLRVMLELMDADGSYKNIEVYDTYSVGRIRVKFSDYHDEINNKDSIDFTNIQTLTFLLENIPDGENPVLNIESIQLFTSGQIPDLGSEADTLLISQMYVTDTASKVTPKNENGSVDAKATVSSAAEWTLATWYFDDVNMDNYWGAEVNVTTSSKCAVRLEIVYANTIPSINNNCECISFHCDGNETTQTLLLPFIKDEYISSGSEGESNVKMALAGDNSSQADISSDVTQIYLIWGRVTTADEQETDSIRFTINSARLLAKEAYSDQYLTITVNTDEGYCTYYNKEQAYKMPYGMQGTKITGIGNEDTTLTTDTEEYYTLDTSWEYKNENNNLEGGDEVPAGTPLLLQGSEDQNVILSYTAFYADNSSQSEEEESNDAKRLAEGDGDSGEGGSTNSTNLLHGSDTQTTPATMKSITHNDLGDNSVSETSEEGDSNSSGDTTVTDDDYYYYIFTYKTGTQDSEGNYGWPYEKLGFYWSSVYKGGPFCSNAHRAWLALSKDVVDNLGVEAATEGKTIGFVIGDNSNIDDNSAADNETTGIATIKTAAPADGAIYTLQGIRVNSMDRPGIYIVGGRKVVKK